MFLFLNVFAWALHESLARKWKTYFFDNFQAFITVFNQANACASMGLVVEIHNIWGSEAFLIFGIYLVSQACLLYPLPKMSAIAMPRTMTKMIAIFILRIKKKLNLKITCSDQFQDCQKMDFLLCLAST